MSDDNVIQFPGDVRSRQIGELLRLRSGVEVAVYVRDDDTAGPVVDAAIFQPRDDNRWAPAEFDPLVLTLTLAEAHPLGGLLHTAACNTDPIDVEEVDDDNA
jgi:hypothetical protein